jgi:hypothetical protein
VQVAEISFLLFKLGAEIHGPRHSPGSFNRIVRSRGGGADDDLTDIRRVIRVAAVSDAMTE